MGLNNGINVGSAKSRKRVEASQESSSSSSSSLVRAKDGSAFARCEECNKDVPVALISFHSCSLDAKIKMNLEAQVVEKETEIVKKPTQSRKKSSSSEPKAKKSKVEKNANKPKRPPTAFFIFMDDFRKKFKEENPNSKDVKVVAKEGGEKWKSLSDEEKKPYQDKAAELKAEYVKSLEADNAEDEVGSDKEEKEEKEKEEDVSEKKELQEGSEGE